MGDCVHCGQAAGWFKTAHPECEEREEREARKRDEAERAALQARERARAARSWFVAEATRTLSSCGDLRALEALLLDEIIAERLDYPGMKSIVTEGWQKAVHAMLEDGVLSAEEELILGEAIDHFVLNPRTLDADGSLTRAGNAGVLRRVMANEPLQPIGAASPPNFNLTRDETPVWTFENAEYFEDQVRRQTVGGSQGMSFRVLKGVYYRVGAFKGETINTTERKHMDTGTLLVTDQHIYFQGPSEATRIPFRKIISFIPYENGIGLTRDARSAKPQTFVTKDGWFTYNPITNLARRAGGATDVANQ